jgi:sorting nexin-5/6/32
MSLDISTSSSSSFPPAGIMSPAATTAVDLTDGDAFLTVDISDALSERDWVKFTVHTRTSMPEFAKGEFSVIRLHEEFLWLHLTFVDCPDYAGFVIPPAPPKPDFDASREKLRRLGDAEGKIG